MYASHSLFLYTSMLLLKYLFFLKTKRPYKKRKSKAEKPGNQKMESSLPKPGKQNKCSEALIDQTVITDGRTKVAICR